MCSVMDTAIEAYMTPMFFKSKGEAIRAFSDAVKDDKLAFHAHPEHYILFMIGVFDDQSGSLEPSAPQVLLTASDVSL